MSIPQQIITADSCILSVTTVMIPNSTMTAVHYVILNTDTVYIVEPYLAIALSKIRRGPVYSIRATNE